MGLVFSENWAMGLHHVGGGSENNNRSRTFGYSMVSQHPLSIFAFSFGALMVCKITDGAHHVPWRMALPAPY
jgi:hypothetical protein